jgi:uncharacterized protein (DUF4213/DUF364 family)
MVDMTTVAAELIALLERFAARAPLPRVRALHLPPAGAAESRAGEFCALELEDGSLGISYVLLDEATRHFVAADRDAGGLQGADALATARWFAAEAGVKKTLGFAAVNALTSCLFERAGYLPPASTDSIGMLDPQPEERIGMIGFFPPLVKRIAAVGAELVVVELKAELAGEYADYRVTLDAEELRGCSKVLSTSTVLLNDTLDRMLGLCAKARRFVLVGPGAGCLPDPLFARGVTLVGGAWIGYREAFKQALAAGQSWSGAARKTAISADDYPGFEALLARI